MTTFSIGPVRRWRRFAGLFAVLMVLASVLPAHAHAIRSAGIVNPKFGTPGACSLASWVGTGTFTAVETSIFEKNTCAAKIFASNLRQEVAVGGKSTFAAPPTTVETFRSELRQTFTVSATNSWLTFYLLPSTDKPGTGYQAQFVKLYDKNERLIYSKGRNSTLDSNGAVIDAYEFSYNLAAYANQPVTLVVGTVVQPSLLSSPAGVSLTFDFDPPLEGKGPGNAIVEPW